MEDDADNDQHLASHNGEHTYDVHAAQLTENTGTDRIKGTSEDLVEGTPSNHKSDESETYSDPDQPAGLGFCGGYRLEETFPFLPDMADVRILIARDVADVSRVLVFYLVLSLYVFIPGPRPRWTLNWQVGRRRPVFMRALILEARSPKGDDIARPQDDRTGCRTPVDSRSGAGPEVLDGHTAVLFHGH